MSQDMESWNWYPDVLIPNLLSNLSLFSISKTTPEMFTKVVAREKDWKSPFRALKHSTFGHRAEGAMQQSG